MARFIFKLGAKPLGWVDVKVTSNKGEAQRAAIVSQATIVSDGH
jgi:hypothetical protein